MRPGAGNVNKFIKFSRLYSYAANQVDDLFWVKQFLLVKQWYNAMLFYLRTKLTKKFEGKSLRGGGNFN